MNLFFSQKIMICQYLEKIKTLFRTCFFPKKFKYSWGLIYYFQKMIEKIIGCSKTIHKLLSFLNFPQIGFKFFEKQ